jgi:hypothetical protein
MTDQTQTETLKQVTFRNRGKAHRGIVTVGGNLNGWLRASCSCPGSQNGKLTRGATIICDGWDNSNCGG